MQPKQVTLPDGSVYEFDKVDFQYYCVHENVNIEKVEVDTMRNGEHDTYEQIIAVCANSQCEEEIENYQFDEDMKL